MPDVCLTHASCVYSVVQSSSSSNIAVLLLPGAVHATEAAALKKWADLAAPPAAAASEDAPATTEGVGARGMGARSARTLGVSLHLCGQHPSIQVAARDIRIC